MPDIPQDFRDVSQAVGADALLIQGAGGNSSIKLDAGLMWVKASGTWLQRAGDEDIFVAVDWTRVNDNIAGGSADPVAATGLPLGPAGLRPSIETTLHSLMPHRVVFHTHSVNAIVHAVQARAREILKPKLAGLRWNFVPYSKPGLALTRLVAELLAAQPCDVLVIQNHGLVVGGDSAAEALARMREVEDRLATEARPLSPPALTPLAGACADTDFRVADGDVIHQLALDAGAFELARSGSLYPDHVVFLGRGIAGLDSAADLAAFCRGADDDPLRPRAVALKGAGVAHHKDLPAGGPEILAALAQVARRLPKQAELRYLSHAEEQDLVDWEAEKYRRTLEA